MENKDNIDWTESAENKEHNDTNNANRNIVQFKNAITIATIQTDLDNAREQHDELCRKVTEYNDLKNITGAEVPKKRQGRSSTSSRLVQRQSEWLYPSFSEPFNGQKKVFNVSPKTYDCVDAAKQHSILLNYQFNHKIPKINFIDQYVRHFVDDGFVIVMVGWENITAKKEIIVPTYSYQTIPIDEDNPFIVMLSQAMELQTANPAEFRALPLELIRSVERTQELWEAEGQQDYVLAAVTSGYAPQEVDEIISNHPVINIIDIENFYIDPNCGSNIDDAQYCIRSFVTSLAALNQAGIYSNLELIQDISGELAIDTRVAEREKVRKSPAGKSRENKIVHEYWGFWDTEGNGTLTPIVVTFVGDVIIRCVKNPFPDGKIPFVIVPFMPIKNSVFGEANAAIIGDNQRIASALLRANVDLIGRTANAQTAFRKDALDRINRKRYEEGEDFDFNITDGSIKDFIQVLTPPEVPASTQILFNQQSAIAESITGVKGFGDGMTGASLGNVATGIRGVLEASALRATSVQRRLSYGLSLIGAKIVAMNSVFLSAPEVIRITNEYDNQVTTDFSRESITISRDELNGVFDVSVDITTVEENNAKAESLSFLLQTTAQSMGAEFTSLILSEIAELKDLPELAHKLKTWQPQPDPIAMALQQKEIERVAADIAVKQAQARLHNTQASLLELEYVEQGTGTKHAREMALRAEQSKAQMELKEKEAELNVQQELIKQDMEQRNALVQGSDDQNQDFGTLIDNLLQRSPESHENVGRNITNETILN